MKNLSAALCGLFLFAAPALADECSSAQTQADLDGCYGEQFNKADAALNAAYKTLMSKTTPAGQASLRKAETSWLAYRDNQCAFETMGTIGGSIHPMVETICRTTLTEAQTDRLKAQSACQEGDLSCGGQ